MMTKISLVLGDITKQKVDIIVNAANKTLLGGGGVDGAIHKAAGLELLAQCRTLGGCITGQAKITKGYNLPAKYIIHTVGPRYGKENDKEAELLSSCYRNSLDMAKKYNCKIIAFPAISIGAYGYPKQEAVKIVYNTIKEYLKDSPNIFEEIRFVFHTQEDLKIYKRLFV